MSDMEIKSTKFFSKENLIDERDKKLKKACKAFESVFTYEMLKSMRRSIEKCDLFHGGQGEEIYESMLDQELSKKLAGNGINSISNQLYQQLKRIDGTSDTETQTGIQHESGLPLRPLRSAISSEFGWRKDPFTGKRRFHGGIDLPAKEGTEVKAAMSGRVQFKDNQEGYGKVVVIDHGHGFTTLYAHNKDILVEPGAWVTKGSTIAKVGSTGRSTGPHLHFEVKRDGKNLDPKKFLES